MNSSSETSAADAQPAPRARRLGGRMFLFACLLTLLALVGLFLVAFQLNSEQAAWESGKASRQQELKDLEATIDKARREIEKRSDRTREAETRLREAAT